MVDKRKKAVLIVDDQLNWRKVLSALLADEYEITRVGSYEEAQDALLRQDPPFHVAIVDIRLVEEDPTNEEGLRLIARLNRMGTHTNAIVLTGYPSLQTIKKAFRDLVVFDYVEKRPKNGAFDSNWFRKIVRDAVDDSEQRRPRPFVQKAKRVAIIEENETWRGYFAKILQQDDYEVDGVATVHELLDKLKYKTYNLLVINSTLLSEERDILLKIRQYEPDAKIMLVTEANIGKIMQAIRHRDIQNVITINSDGLNVPEFREVVRLSFAPEATKYVTAWFEGVEKQEKLRLGQSYVLVLNLQDVSETGAMSIWLPPRGEKRSKTFLSVSVYAPGMRVQNDGEAYWVIPPRESPSPLKMEITPTTAGFQKLYIDLEEGLSWLGRLEKEVEVVDATHA